MAPSRLRFFQPDRSVPSVNPKQVAAAVQLSTNVVAAELSFHGQGQIDGYMTVTGFQIYVRRKLVWKLDGDIPIAGAKAPRGSQRRTRSGTRVNAPVAGRDIHLIEASVRADVSIA